MIATGGPHAKTFSCPSKLSPPVFRAIFRDQLQKTGLFALLETHVWRKDWEVHSQPVGSGFQAFQYLAPYIFRVALSNHRLCNLHDGQVTFTYQESATDHLNHSTIAAEEFIRRFLQHVLPRASSKSVTTACSARLIGNCYSRPVNCSLPPPAN